MNLHIPCEHSSRRFNYTVITNKLVVIRVIYFPVLSRKGYKKPQEFQQGPKYMPHLSVPGTQLSLLLMDMLYSVLEQLIC